MGQSSSQVDAGQEAEEVNVQGALTQACHPSPLKTTPQPNILQLPNPPRQNMAPPKIDKKRARPVSSSADEDLLPQIVKKLKTNDQHVPKKKATAGRSMPQHRRGTAIRPSQGVLAQQPIHVNWQIHNEQNGNAVPSARPQSSSSSEDEFYDASSIAMETGAGDSRETRQVEGRVKTVRQPAVVAAKVKTSKKGGVEDENVVMNDVVVNPVGKPGPQRKKKAKRIQNAEKTNEQTATKTTGTARVTSNARSPTSSFAPLISSTPKTAFATLGPKQEYRDLLALRKDQIDWAVLDTVGKEMRQKLKEALQKETDSKTRSAMIREFVFENGLQMLGHPSTQSPGRPSVATKLQRELVPDDTSARKRQLPKGREEADVPSPPAAHADRIPTPPTSANRKPEQGDEADEDDVLTAASADNVDDAAESHDPNYNPQVRAVYVKPTKHIADWLRHPHSPAPPDQVPPSMGSPNAGRLKPVPKKRKKAVAQKSAERMVDDEDDDEYQADEADNEAAVDLQPKSKTKRRKSAQAENDETRVKTPKPAPESVRGVVKGAWTAEEKATADSIFKDWEKEYENSFQLRAAFIDFAGSIPQGLKDDIYDAFPFRTKRAIKNFFQRRYHAYGTGEWTPEEDATLKELYEKYRDEGKEGWWVEIGSWLQRPPEACRTRWKNVVKLGKEMNVGPWSGEEERELVRVVRRQVDEIGVEFAKQGIEKGDEELEKLINWEKVSDSRVNVGKRSAKRCIEKWQALKRRGVTFDGGYDDEEEGELGNTTVQTSIDSQQLQQNINGFGEAKPALSKKQRAVENAFQKLGWGDVYDALDEICAATHHQLDKTYLHESTFWSIVGTYIAKNQPESKFRSCPKLRKKCYYAALELWGEVKEKEVGGREIARNAEILRDVVWELGVGNPEISFERKLEGKKNTGTGKEGGATSAGVSAAPVMKANANANANNNERVLTSKQAPERVDTDSDWDDVGAGFSGDDENRDQDLGMVDGNVVDEIPMSSVNSRFDAESLRSRTPRLGVGRFLQRCRGGRT